VYRSQIRDVDQLKSRLAEEWEHSIDKAVRQWRPLNIFELAFDFEHTVDILNKDYGCAEVLLFARTHTLDSQSRLCPQWTLMLLRDLTKLAAAVADVDRFCCTLVTCLPFNVSLLM